MKVRKGTEHLVATSPNLRHLRNLWMILLLATWALFNTSASAATLYGRVVEVNDGDTITIFNLNRPVRVRLLAVDAPDGEQPYADVAKEHLASLVLHKSVTVEYSGLGHNSYLLGKVFLRETDIGAQMLRDGVAWFDANSRLADSDRQIYSECEKAARAEQRGLWQAPEPIAPWDFKQKQIARTPEPKRLSSQPDVTERKVTLASEDFIQGLTGSKVYSVSRASSSTGGDGNWRTLAPDDDHFVIQVPGDGVTTSKEVPAGDETANINYWIANYEGASYLVMWSRGPNLTYTDASAIQDMAKGLVVGLTRGLAQQGIDLEIDAKLQRNLKLDGYEGSQFIISNNQVPGLMRAFSKQFGDRREMYLIGVLNGTEQNPSVEKFFKSFTLRRSSSDSRR